ncbi:hypothetical protein DSC45_30785 [Streptomyces sp. YIM 130001]|uniref:antitoxin n=1 Tax=Streptomyces sp. YIM 130001 TaxID=2259644 RepID=UPI000E64F6B5|nr:antitoxin [Streptomyces sp. YIM 130001]RII09468.1 hypothetical protein DSC45_30785 [Streptomyces sp. YIM 130001]
MGLLDSLKAKLGPAKDKASGLAKEHGDKIDQGLDKAARTVDQKTKGKYSNHIRTGTEKAKGAVDRLGSQDGSPGADTKDTGGYSPVRPTDDGPTPPQH